jgi:replicative DNA helicase
MNSIEQRSQELELGVLSILISFNSSMDEVCDFLKPEHFANEFHRALFVEIASQVGKGQPCDVLTLFDANPELFSLSEVNEIAQYHSYSAKGIVRLARALVDRFREGQLARLSGVIATLASENGPINDRIDRAQVELSKLSETTDADEWVDAYEAAIMHTELIEHRADGKVVGIQTGLYDLDETLDGGMQRGNLVVIGARPSMGKTALGMTMGLHIAQSHSVGFLSMEMPHADVRDRQTAILSHVPISSIKRPKKGLEYDRIVEGIEKARMLKFRVSDKSGLNINQVRSKARALKRRKGLDVLVVDYIGLMSGLDPKAPRAYQIEEISRGLKSLAKELDIVVMCLAQVNRGAAERVNQVPGLHDLRDSGAIEQDADVVLFVHRPIVSNPDLGGIFANYALMRVAKNRQGRIGDVHLSYLGEYTKFGSWEGQPPSMGVSSKGAQKGRDF